MEQKQVLDLMRKYFESNQKTVLRDNFSEQPVTELLSDSLDVVEFLVHLEDALGLATEIDLNRLGPAMVNKNFGELAEEIVKFMQPRASGG